VVGEDDVAVRVGEPGPVASAAQADALGRLPPARASLFGFPARRAWYSVCFGRWPLLPSHFRAGDRPRERAAPQLGPGLRPRVGPPARGRGALRCRCQAPGPCQLGGPMHRHHGGVDVSGALRRRDPAGRRPRLGRRRGRGRGPARRAGRPVPAATPSPAGPTCLGRCPRDRGHRGDRHLRGLWGGRRTRAEAVGQHEGFADAATGGVVGGLGVMGGRPPWAGAASCRGWC
jgi:hypothetical protein